MWAQAQAVAVRGRGFFCHREFKHASYVTTNDMCQRADQEHGYKPCLPFQLGTHPYLHARNSHHNRQHDASNTHATEEGSHIPGGSIPGIEQ